MYTSIAVALADCFFPCVSVAFQNDEVAKELAQVRTKLGGLSDSHAKVRWFYLLRSTFSESSFQEMAKVTKEVDKRVEAERVKIQKQLEKQNTFSSSTALEKVWWTCFGCI